MRTIPSLSLTVLALALAPVARAAETRVGFVDMRRAVYEVEEGKAATTLLKKDFDEKQKQLDAKQAEVQQLGADFEKQQAVLSDQVKAQKAAELDKRVNDVRQLYVQLQQDLSQREQEALKGIFERMSPLVKDIAEGEGLQMVVERSNVVWATQSLDITNEVIRKYNAKYPPKAGGAAAAPADPKPKPPKPPKAATK